MRWDLKHLRKVLLWGALFFLCVPSAFAADTIKIGQTASLTGEFAKRGNTEVEAAAIALDEVNKAGGVLGRPVELVVVDDESTADGVIEALKQFAERGDIVAVIGPDGNSMAAATKYDFDEARIPRVLLDATSLYTSMNLEGKTLPYSFSLSYVDRLQGKAVAEFIIKKLNLRKAAVLYSEAVADNDTFYLGDEDFTLAYEDYDGEVLGSTGFAYDDRDFPDALEELMKLSPEVLVFDPMGDDLAIVMLSARRRYGAELPIVVVDRFDPAYWNLGDALQNTYWLGQMNPDSAAGLELAEKYKKRTGSKLRFPDNAALAEDAVLLLCDAIQRAGSTDHEAVARSLEETKQLKLNHLNLTMGRNHYPLQKSFIFVRPDIDTGRVTFVAEIRPKEDRTAEQ